MLFRSPGWDSQVGGKVRVSAGLAVQPVGVGLNPLSALFGGRPGERAFQVNETVKGFGQKHLVVVFDRRFGALCVQQGTHRRQFASPRTEPASRHTAQQFVLEINQRCFGAVVGGTHQRRTIGVIDFTCGQGCCEPVERGIEFGGDPGGLSSLGAWDLLGAAQPGGGAFTELVE